jgi:hypothetical protein
MIRCNNHRNHLYYGSGIITLIVMSRNLEVAALQIANSGWNNIYRLP